MITVKTVAPKSPAARAGILPGDIIISVNGHDVNDVFDISFYSKEKKVDILFHRGPELFTKHIKKGEYEDLGVSSDTFLMDDKRTCKNKCIFCFIDQNPKGMRDTIYFKDDDSRLSFLHGCYVTLTNMTDSDIERIINMHMSPINISVHTTNPELRTKMLKNPRSGEVLSYIPKLCAAGIKVNCQIVLCKGIHDGDELVRTLNDLSLLYPGVESISVVPSGLTSHRCGLYPLLHIEKEDALKTLEIVSSFGDEFKQKNGVRLAYASDEFYLKAGIPLPDEDYYDGYPQLENGVGMITSMKAEFYDELNYVNEDYSPTLPREVSIATGAAAYGFISEISSSLEKALPGLKINVYEIKNKFFGESVTVAGLVCGCDLISQLSGVSLGDRLFISSSMLRDEGDKFLDDVTLKEAEATLGVKIIPTDSSGADFIRNIVTA